MSNNDGRAQLWVAYLGGTGGYVCAEQDLRRSDGICGMPIETEPCDLHG